MFLYDFLLRVTPPKKKHLYANSGVPFWLVPGRGPKKKSGCTSHILKVVGSASTDSFVTIASWVWGLVDPNHQDGNCLVVESQAKPLVISCHDCILAGVLLIQINPNLSPSPTTFFLIGQNAPVKPSLLFHVSALPWSTCGWWFMHSWWIKV